MAARTWVPPPRAREVSPRFTPWYMTLVPFPYFKIATLFLAWWQAIISFSKAFTRCGFSRVNLFRAHIPGQRPGGGCLSAMPRSWFGNYFSLRRSNVASAIRHVRDSLKNTCRKKLGKGE